MTTKRCKVHYRRLRRDNDQFSDLLLSEAIGRALNVDLGEGPLRDVPRERVANVPNAEEYRRILLHSFTDDGNAFGTICMFAPGQQQALLRLAEEKNEQGLAQALREWEIREAQAPDGHEYIHGITYWLAIEDHFYQIQHVSLQAKACEEYLTWLLRDKAEIIESSHYVELQSVFDRDQVGEDLTSLEIGGLVPETVHYDDGEEYTAQEIEERRAIADRISSTFDKSRRILEELFGEVETGRILESVPDEASLEVKVNIGYKARRTQLRRSVMAELEKGLRNIPDGEIRAKGPGGTIKGNDARLSLDMGVKLLRENSSLLDLEHARDRMLEVHRRFLDDDKIQT